MLSEWADSGRKRRDQPKPSWERRLQKTSSRISDRRIDLWSLHSMGLCDQQCSPSGQTRAASAEISRSPRGSVGYRKLPAGYQIGGLTYGVCIAWAFVTNNALRVGRLGPQAQRSAEALVGASATENFQQDIRSED